ncbi:MAG: rhomboid family intramembrane serine protease [Trueperaceae bacterium]|nr:MAG: rhomboid family intramembrane serine protease [Trueperaceae bacterium]
MTQDVLFLLVVVIAGLYGLRWTLRLSPLSNELPLKTLVATALSALVVGSALFSYQLSDSLRLLTLIFAPLYVFALLVLTTLARSRRYGLASFLTRILYWTQEGREALQRLLAQVALRQGDVDQALEFIPQRDPLMLAQAYALKQQWPELLALELPSRGDNAFLGGAAQVEALIALGRFEDAEVKIATLRRRWQDEGQGPIGYRSIVLSEARLAAERGDIATVRDLLQEPLIGVAPHLLFGIVARAAEQAEQPEQAQELYSRAYEASPVGFREVYAGALRRYGRALPEVSRRQVAASGTLSLLAAILVSYLGQLFLDRLLGPIPFIGIDPSTAAGAFLLNIPGVPESNMLWRYLSYAFLHGNLVHIGFNSWVLFDIGRIFESRRGWGNLLAAFTFGTAMGAYLTTVAQAGDQLALVGASGGVLGVAGALLAEAWRGSAPGDRQLTRSLVQWMVLIVLFSTFVPNVSLWGHVGGVVGGLLWGFLRQGLPGDRRIDLVAGVVSIALLTYAVARALAVVLRYML